MTEQAYQDALQYVLDRTDYSRMRGLTYSPEKFNTRRISEFLALLGNPHHQFSVFHVAGTKGKGSIASLLASVLRVAGYQAGLFTSPFLMDYCEQIQVNGTPIPHQTFADLVNDVKKQAEAVPDLTSFELLTGMAFAYFFGQKVNVAVVEAGLGGELDATNVVQPLVSVISSISYDHIGVLGNSLASIARHKAGIIKTGRPAVVSPQKEEALQVIRQTARERDARLIEADREYTYEIVRQSLQGQTFIVKSSSFKPKDSETQLRIRLLGRHQVENAVTAYAALVVARAEGLSISNAHIRTGFSRAVWHGRFEVLQKSPPVVLDVAHNPDSARRLAATVKEYFPNSAVQLVFGLFEDKDREGILAELLPLCKRLFIASSGHARAADPALLAETAHRLGHSDVQIYPSVESAFTDALALAKPARDLVLVTGNIFVVGVARAFWQREH
jgi:dihydrofolate synthase/folylpolyglutamate synthase